MNVLERIPTRWLLTAAALGCLILWAAPGWAQSPNATGMPGFITHSGGDCVQDRCSKIGDGAFADISSSSGGSAGPAQATAVPARCKQA